MFQRFGTEKSGQKLQTLIRLFYGHDGITVSLNLDNVTGCTNLSLLQHQDNTPV